MTKDLALLGFSALILEMCLPTDAPSSDGLIPHPDDPAPAPVSGSGHDGDRRRGRPRGRRHA